MATIMTSYQYLWGCSNTHRNRKSDIYVNSKETLFQLKVNLEGVPGARMKMISFHATQEHWGVTITSMDVSIPTSSKDPQGIPACLESDPPFLEAVQTVVQWHLHEISRTAGFLVRLAGFKWKLSVSAKWWPDTRTDSPISGIPHVMAGCDFPLCVCACSTCVLPHLKDVVMALQGACCPRWTKRESGSLLFPGPAEAVSSFPQLKITVCRFYVRACQSWSSSHAAHQWVVKHRLLVPDAASAPFLLQKVCRSHFFWFLRTPQK